MSFVRSLNERQIAALYDNRNVELFKLLKTDIASGVVFPAVRKNQLYFYYKGGCLYKFSNGKFTRDREYRKYSPETVDLTEYEKAKIQNEHKYIDTVGNSKERQLLNSLYRYTFGNADNTHTIVLDIEINLNGTVGCGRKCDLVLYNLQSKTLMFVEGKVFSDSRVNVKNGYTPEVIEQVNIYTAAIGEQEQNIIEQYGNHIDIVNDLFDTSYKKPHSIIKTAKLLVYETPLTLTENNRYSVETINFAIGSNNVAWFKKGENPSLDTIWENLCR